MSGHGNAPDVAGFDPGGAHAVPAPRLGGEAAGATGGGAGPGGPPAGGGAPDRAERRPRTRLASLVGAVTRLARLRWLRTTVTVGILLAAAVFVGHGIVEQRDELGAALGALHPGLLAVAFVPVVLGVVVTALSWRAPLVALAGPVSARDAVRLFAAGAIGKYVPGVMWSVVLQAQLAAGLGITAARITAAFGVYLAVSVATGAGVALPVAAARWEDGWLVFGAVGCAVLVLLLTPWLLRLATRLATSVPAVRARLAPVPLGPLRRSVWLCVLSWLVTGAHVWVLAVGLGADPVAALLPSVGGFALAMVAGSLAFLVPDGLGVREGVLVLMLSTCLPVPAAVVVATVSRLLLALADVTLFVHSSWSGRRRARRTPSPVAAAPSADSAAPSISSSGSDAS
ncbi:lysylphosphatidylglycerol synthase domain-containing protein [Actinoalloteichus spitiensis]|uniref:lysylphosphatidylglycerol synthase domain-containing protein n=1 Tax=Actinoalloteichus spitiensis TaxID=252394 RepID=UPI00036EB97F|nr:lysylphosphatidylglycerol synthase domain-containing protein [Actinoalloteichus spitiensis]